jgi:hypothetical protein
MKMDSLRLALETSTAAGTQNTSTGDQATVGVLSRETRYGIRKTKENEHAAASTQRRLNVLDPQVPESPQTLNVIYKAKFI